MVVTMKVIGLTGGIASGKSAVARFLKELGVVVMDADKIGHKILRSDTRARRELIAAFGEGILTPAGSVSRRQLAKIVFGNPGSLLRLNIIMHPRILERVKDQVDIHRKEGAKVVVIEAPLLLEAGWASLVDEIWVTVASEANVLKRLRERASLLETDSLKRLRSQMPAEERVRQADVIIDTDCDLYELKEKVAKLWQELGSH